MLRPTTKFSAAKKAAPVVIQENAVRLGWRWWMRLPSGPVLALEFHDAAKIIQSENVGSPPCQEKIDLRFKGQSRSA